MTTVRHRLDQGGAAVALGDGDGFRGRLLVGLAAAIAEKGYPATTIADIVRLARTSRRTFYEHFASKDECFIALLTILNASLVEQISASYDLAAPWQSQVRQAVETWVAYAETDPAIMLSAIRDLPALGEVARRLHREMMEAFVTMIHKACDTDAWRAAGASPVSRQVVILLVGGLYELAARTVEDGGRISDITEVAVQSSIALLAPRTPTAQDAR